MRYSVQWVAVGWLGLTLTATAKPVPYEQPTAQQEQAEIADARLQAKQIAARLGLHLHEIETDHCLIFTDWDEREDDFLRVNLEGAYAAVSRQFDLSAHQNIFIGRLPVYMLKDQEEFTRFAADVDHYAASPRVAGYYWGRSDGIGHLVMWKPKIDDNNRAKAMRDWGYVLAHEFTHAFVARYRTNARIPTWLNEGLAEIVASSVFPRPKAREQARLMAADHPSIASIFQAQHPDAPWYPVMQTLVQTLIARDRPAFLKMFDQIKAGASVEQALKNCYGWSESDLERAWRRYISS